MKKFFFLCMLCFMAQTIQSQRCAVLEFKAGVRISQEDVDGISAIFITYFRPAGYTMVERTQINKVIEEQGFQRSKMTQAQMVRVGEILNVSKIVVGDVNVVMGQYNVDARVINVETGTISATEGATFSSSSYRSNMQSIATKLAAKIAITPGPSVKATPSTSTTYKRRSEVKVLYDYLKVFPEELGTFQAEPTSVIAQINKQAMHGYNNWRIPTNEELSLMKANDCIGNDEYMTRENRRGIVLLVSDGEDYETVQAEEREKERLAEEDRMKAEQERKRTEEQNRIKEEQELKAAELKAQGYVDLGLPSGTLWKNKNEVGLFNPKRALEKFQNNLPSKEQFEELINECNIQFEGCDINVTGPNGNSICFPASGFMMDEYADKVSNKGSSGEYWSSTPANPLVINGESTTRTWSFSFFKPWNQKGVVEPMFNERLYSIRLVYNK